MRRQLDHDPAFDQRLAHQADVEVLQVAQAAVNHLRTATAGAGGEIVTLDQRHVVAAAGSIERDAGAGHATADDEHVKDLARQRMDRCVSFDHGFKLAARWAVVWRLLRRGTRIAERQILHGLVRETRPWRV